LEAEGVVAQADPRDEPQRMAINEAGP
jgi:hypothetical protein